jgi:hypothetical protein
VRPGAYTRVEYLRGGEREGMEEKEKENKEKNWPAHQLKKSLTISEIKIFCGFSSSWHKYELLLKELLLYELLL